MDAHLLTPPCPSDLFSADDRRLLTPSLLADLSSPLLPDLVWERLHTGHWASVPVAWRRLYALLRLREAASLLRAASPGLPHLLRVLSLLDDGLTMGAPLPGDPLAELAAAVHRQAVAATPGSVLDDVACREAAAAAVEGRPAAENDRVRPLERVTRPSVQEFARRVAAGRPALLEGCLGEWGALGRWSMSEMCRRAGYRTVPVEVGRSYADHEWRQQRMRLIDFVREFVLSETREQRPTGYLAQHQLFNQVPDLLDDVPPPDYCYCLEEGCVDANIWLGPEGTVSPLHHDPRPNLLAQVVGSKYVELFLPEESARLYPHPGSLLANTSQVDAEQPDLERFPEFAAARGFHCVLRPGEMLFIPPRCWHYVRSLAPSISVNLWFD